MNPNAEKWTIHRIIIMCILIIQRQGSCLVVKQLQSEAKRHGIKANQKIDILRLKVLEAIETTKSNNESYTDRLSNLTQNDCLSFLVESPLTSTPAPKKIEKVDKENLDLSSTDDIDKMFISNKRNSQFFDDVLNFTDKEWKNSTHSDSLNISNGTNVTPEKYATIPNEDNISSHKILSESNENIPRKIRKLNTTFELTEEDLQESQITDEQRKKATMKISEDGDKIVSHVSDIVFRSTSNLQTKYVMLKEQLKNKVPINNQKIQDDFSSRTEKTVSSSQSKVFKKPLVGVKPLKNTIRPSENLKKSICPPKPVEHQSKPIYKRPSNIPRSSLLPVPSKSRRNTTGFKSPQKPSWRK